MVEIFNSGLSVKNHCFYEYEGRKRRFDPVEAFSVKRVSNAAININKNDRF